jgi:hypothetical protein
MASENTNSQRVGQSTAPYDPNLQNAFAKILAAKASLAAEREQNGLGERGRALSTAITKLDEARLWLVEAERL